MKRRQVKPLAASLLDALDYDSSDDSDFEVGDASGKLFYFFKSFLLKNNNNNNNNLKQLVSFLLHTASFR